MITYRTDMDIAGCEDLISLVQRKDCNTERLKLTNKIGLSSVCGGSVSVVQAIITWARQQKEPKIVTYIQSAEDLTTIENLAKRLHGLVGLMMAANVLAVDGKTSIRLASNAVVKKRVLSMERGDLRDTGRGMSVNLVCIDHSTMGFLSSFYHGSGVEDRLRGESDFVDLMQRMIVHSVSESQFAKMASGNVRVPSNLRVLGGILKELFANTHDHARNDANGRPWRKSVRGVHTGHRMVDTHHPERSSGGFAPLERYFRWHARAVQDEHLQFVEISVFDSGPGYASRMLKRRLDDNVTILDEYAAVSRCFLKHETSKERSTDGLGLYRILGLLKTHGGFFRLRTGRLSLYRYFEPTLGLIKKEPEASDLVMYDAESGTTDITAFAPAEGTVVTILLPVGKRTS